MKGFLIVNGFLQTAKFTELAELFAEASKRLSIELTIIKNSEILVDVGLKNANSGFAGENRPDFILFWDKDVLLAEWFENMGIPVYNSAHCIALCDDKRKMHLALEKKHLPVPETILAPMTFSGIGFTEVSFLNQVEDRLSYPMVVKEGYGSFGAQVYLARDREELESIIKKCSTTEILFQRFVKESAGKDIRLQIVGDRVTGSMYRFSEKDFRANLSAGGKMQKYHPGEEEIQLARAAAAAVEADFAGVDLLFGKNGPLVCEVNSNAHFKNLLDCTGVNTAYEILSYIRKKGTA